MFHVLVTLIALNVLACAVTSSLGFLIGDSDSILVHFIWGLGTTIGLVFTHLLVMFYLIGSEGDVKEALEAETDLADRFLPEVKQLKWSVFPWASASALLVILAAMFGAEVHSRMLSLTGVDAAPAVRSVGAWWLHSSVELVALVVCLLAFAKEVAVVRRNRRIIDAINAELDTRAAAPAEAGAEGG